MAKTGRKPKANAALYGQELPSLPASVPVEIAGDPGAAEAYKALVAEVGPIGHLRKCHLRLVLVTARALALEAAAYRDMIAEGRTLETKRGTIVNPNVRVWEYARAGVVELAKELAMTPLQLQAMRTDLRAVQDRTYRKDPRPSLVDFLPRNKVRAQA